MGNAITLPSLVLLDVGLDIEVEEEDEEHGTMEEDDIAVFFGKVTLNEYWKSCMYEECCKLDQLHCCQVSKTFITKLKDH